MQTSLLLFAFFQIGDPSPETSTPASSDWTIVVAIVMVILFLAVAIPLVIWLVKRNSTSGRLHGDYNPIPSPIREVKLPPAVPPPGNPKPGSPPEEKRETPQPSAISAIFISYRRDDSGDVTGRIYDRLTQHFGKEVVFKDVDSIPLGVDFRKHLGDSVGQCDVLLAVLGRNWLGGMEGQRRIDDERDFVRIEIEAALQRDIPVVPVLVQGATVPEPQALPKSLQPLVYRHGIPVRPDPDFHGDMDKLIRGIEKYLKEKRA